MMIKVTSLLIFFALGQWDSAAAESATCSQQMSCFDWYATERKSTICKKEHCKESCEWELCVGYRPRRYGCDIRNYQFKTCLASDTTCEPKLSEGRKVTNLASIGDEVIQCQFVPPGGAAHFLFEANEPAVATSSEAPTDELEVEQSLLSFDVSCARNYDSEMSCFQGDEDVSFNEGNERIFTFQAPKICQTYIFDDPIEAASACGEPHFQTWSGEKYDFHGVCDLVLLENENFKDGIDMYIHIRTKEVAKKFSYISNAVLYIGEDTLEVSAGNDGSKVVYWINGVSGKEINENSEVILSQTIYGYPITYRKPSGKQAEFEIDLGNNDNIIIRTWGDFVRVGMKGKQSTFKNSRGLLGTIDGTKVARDNITVLHDVNEFGQEWQVQHDDPKLFHNREGPQYPEKCIIPSAVDMKRHLRESSISQEEAEVACSRVIEEERDMCVFDVMATSNLDVAGAY